MRHGYRRLSAALTLTLFLTGCAGQDRIETDPDAAEYGTIKISQGISSETETVANIYAKALQRTGYSVEIVDTGTSREDYLQAMGGLENEPETAASSGAVSGESKPSNDPATVDLTPDYSGNLLYQLTDDGAFSTSFIEQERAASTASASPALSANKPVETPSLNPSISPSARETSLQAPSMSSGDILDSIDRLLPDSLELLDASAGQNRDALVITQATAAKLDTNSLEEISQRCSTLVFGAPASFSEKPYGLKTLEKYYRCKPKKVITFDSQEELSEALASDEVQVANIYSASSQISQNGYQVLEDSAGIFIPQQIVPVIRAEEMPSSAREAVKTVSRKISSENLKNFDRLTHGTEAMTPEEVAEFWLNNATE